MADLSQKKKPRLIQRSISRVASSGAKSKEADGDGSNSGFLPGMIRHVSLVNFMNHASLELKLEPSVNILTGKNGAGKSSV